MQHIVSTSAARSERPQHGSPHDIEVRPGFSWRKLKHLVMAGFVLYVAATIVRIHVRGYDVFLADYLRWTLTSPESTVVGPTHVFFLLVDHFEPAYDRGRTESWAARYRALAARHQDSTGRPPQHTWFYPGEQFDRPILETLRTLVRDGFGEVELHFHHEYDTAATLRSQLLDSIAAFQDLGFLRTIAGETRFAFVHGNFALDNSDGDWVCGVNEELKLLSGLGSFADFTFPSIYSNSQPRIVNSIYAAKDDERSKSYDRKLALSALLSGEADLMMFEGPLLFAPSLNLRHLFLDLDDGNLHAITASRTRVDRWVRANIHVPGRPEWVFIKVFTHGISSPEEEAAALGPTFDDALAYLEERYNDGQRYKLHYITAREAYNLAIAAAKGKSGDPQQYLDVPIQRYVADPAVRVTKVGAPASNGTYSELP